MKKISFIITVSFIVCSMWTTAAYAANEKANPIELPLKDDNGQNWVLQNENAEYRLKWSISSESPYQHYEAEKVDDHLVMINNFNEVFLADDQGHVLWNIQGGSQDIEHTVDGNFVTATNDFGFLNPKNTTTKSTITRFDVKGNVLNQYTDLTLTLIHDRGIFGSSSFFTFDSKGNLIALLPGGLTSMDAKGNTLWTLKEVKDKDWAFDVFSLQSLAADSQNHILAEIDNKLLCLDLDGKLLWSTSLQNADFGKIHSGKYLTVDGKLFSATETGMKEVTDPKLTMIHSGKVIDHHGGYFQVDEKKSVLNSRFLDTDQVRWSYELSAQESAAGYNIANNFKGNMISDEPGNVYVSTNGGTVHALDRDGNPRFTLEITNKIIGYSQIVSLNKNTIIITNNRHVLCLERVSEQKSEISLQINQKEQNLAHRLFMQDGRAMISLREIFELLGAKVSWDPDKYQITAERNGKKIGLQIGSKDAFINGNAITFDTAPILVEDVTYVPLRYVSEALGSQVDWDDMDQMVLITDK